ncbi:NADP-dependent oxidoreductase [Lentzea sp. NPDC051838]|uniref:NADP-dependent oxidoreductase n=1 Tax=Lentzea sp. NPDC051838 TaxID=3154849 RepID=UPI00341967B7
MTDSMLALSQDEFGGPEVLRLTSLPVPRPSVGEILIRVRAASVNPVDVYNRERGVLIGQLPFVLGWDVSGTVAAVGPGVTIHAPGDEVFGLLPFPRGHGAYAQFAVGPARAFVPKPDRLTHVEAAALPLAGLTAWQALVETAGLGAGSRVLITGAAGGVGHLAVQIAKARGAHVIAQVSPDNAEFVRSLGADELIDYTTTPDFTAVAGDLDIVLEAVGSYAAQAVAALKPGGVLVATLAQSLAPVAEDAARQGVRAVSLLVESDRLGMTALAQLVEDGLLTPTVAATYPLGQAGLAQSTKSGPGKTVLVIDKELA